MPLVDGMGAIHRAQLWLRQPWSVQGLNQLGFSIAFRFRGLRNSFFTGKIKSWVSFVFKAFRDSALGFCSPKECLMVLSHNLNLSYKQQMYQLGETARICAIGTQVAVALKLRALEGKRNGLSIAYNRIFLGIITG